MNIQNLDVISVNIWGILISLANLVIMYFIVKKFLFRPVQKVMADRGAEVGRVYSDADRALAEAEKSRDEYEAKLAASDEEAGNIIRAAKERASAESRDIISAADRKAAAMLKKADEDIAFEKKKAIHDVKNEISGISVEIAEKMIGRELKEEDHRALIDSYIDGIGK